MLLKLGRPLAGVGISVQYVLGANVVSRSLKVSWNGHRATGEVEYTRAAFGRSGGKLSSETRRSIHAAIHGSGTRSRATDRFTSPGRSLLIATGRPARRYITQQRPDRSQKRPAEEAGAFGSSLYPAPGTPQSRPHPPPRRDIIDPSLSLHRGPHNYVDNNSEPRLRFIDTVDSAQPYHANNCSPK